MSEIADTLAERGKRYGTFMTNASCAQAIKRAIWEHCAWHELQPDQQEALELICTKISRCVTGDPNHIDNWHDIAGYATLVEQRLRKDQNT